MPKVLLKKSLEIIRCWLLKQNYYNTYFKNPFGVLNHLKGLNVITSSSLYESKIPFGVLNHRKGLSTSRPIGGSIPR